ncbi:MAG: hypothetical protein WC744_00020 [Patescibacteria group bacterium]|jgi:hypothetical protein
MYDNIKTSFNRLVKIDEFQNLVADFRSRFGIPLRGFDYSNPEEYKNWITDAIRKTDHLKDSFLFIAKRCKNIAPSSDPVPLAFLSCYFFFNSIPIKNKNNKEIIFLITPSGILGNFDIIFTVPLIFSLNDFLSAVEKNKSNIEETIKNTQSAIDNIKSSDKKDEKNKLNPKLDFLETTPANGSDIVDRVHRLIGYLVEFGRISLREHLRNLKDKDFIIEKYEDKNKSISQTVRQMGVFLMNRGLYTISEEYWKQINDEIILFNETNNRNVNRGISLANQGVSQIAQGKVIEGLFNLYKAYDNDKNSLAHLKEITINPNKDLAQSILYTQFENRQISRLFGLVIRNYSHTFLNPLSELDFKKFILNLSPDKKILLFVTLYRFSFSYELNKELSNPISRGEILRSLSELALWYEDELKRKDPSLQGMLGNFMDLKIGQMNNLKGEYTYAKDLDELEIKIKKSISSGDNLNMINARITTCVRNFTGHNYESHEHVIFEIVDEIIARMISLIYYSYTQSWI